ncbi:cache domain-containing sensor histidine kinase [Paenibacillus daejeonensis]|uniref:cache domain-containing sensor histidine kinase n=1 Tax=Paenibacillus daejeonensis TaxID=135193 RepID=UPI00039B6E08|nr:sensor histidine kinase [Paenibacillus daejeonensis]
MIPLSLIAVINYMKSASILEAKAREQFQYLSEGTNQQVNQYVSNIDTISLNVIEAPVIQERLEQSYVLPLEWTILEVREEAEVKSFLAGIHKLTTGLSGIAVYGFNGIYDSVHPALSLSLDYEPTGEAWYREAMASGGSWVLSGRRVEREFVSFQREPQEDVVTFARQIKNLHTLEPMGVLAINIKASELVAILGIPESPRHVVVLGRDGQPVIMSEAADTYMHSDQWLQSSTVSPVTGWRSIHLMSRDELFRESRTIRNFIMILTIALSVAAIFAARLLSSGIVKPLLNLKLKMQDVERGRLDGKIQVIHRDEVGELTQRFNRMLERMGELLEENVQREQQKAQLEMDALQARINPHFLYNTLMALRIQAITDGNAKLGEQIASLVHLLQFSAKNKRMLVPLGEELELIRRYTSLLHLRHENFELEMQVQDGMAEHLVIPFLLQPIVENAIFHGIGPLGSKGTVRIMLRLEGNSNIAMIVDDGVGMPEEKLRSLLAPGDSGEGQPGMHKIGVRNVYERLKLQFGPEAEMMAASGMNQGTTITVAWPVIKEGDIT